MLTHIHGIICLPKKGDRGDLKVEGISHATHQHSFTRAAQKHIKPNFINKVKNTVTDGSFILAVMGIMVGRVSMLDTLSPFGIAFLVSTALVTKTKNTAIVGIAIVLGLLTRMNGYHTIEAIASIMIIFLVLKMLKLSSKNSTLKAVIVVFVLNSTVSVTSSLLLNGSFIL